MGGIGLRSGQQIVKTVFWIIGEVFRKLKAQAAELWGTDGHQQCRNGFPPTLQILNACSYEIISREGIHLGTYSSTPDSCCGCLLPHRAVAAIIASTK